MAIGKSHNIEYTTLSRGTESRHFLRILDILPDGSDAVRDSAIFPNKVRGYPTEICGRTDRNGFACGTGRGRAGAVLGLPRLRVRGYLQRRAGLLHGLRQLRRGKLRAASVRVFEPIWRQRHKNGHFTLGQAVED